MIDTKRWKNHRLSERARKIQENWTGLPKKCYGVGWISCHRKECKRTGGGLSEWTDVMPLEECRRAGGGLTEKCRGVRLVSCRRRNIGEMSFRWRDVEEVLCCQLGLSEKLSHGRVWVGVARVGIRSYGRNRTRLR